MKIRFLEAASVNTRNGNVVTSERWRSMFESLGHRVEIFSADVGRQCDLLVVFNAYTNRQAIREAWRSGVAGRIVICLTGTDLYRDLQEDPGAQDVLHLADQLVVLQPMGIPALPEALHGKTMVVFQSAVAPKVEVSHQEETFDVCGIAHLRDVKDPLRTAHAARLLPADSRIRVVHVGKALSAEFGQAVIREVAENPRFHWLGEQSGARTAEILLGSRLLVVSSLLEGGANVVSEAVVSGIPVIGSDIPCLRGLLGDDYPGLFPVGDTPWLAELLYRAEVDSGFYAELQACCRREAYKFDPQRERDSLKFLVERVFSEYCPVSEAAISPQNQSVCG